MTRHIGVSEQSPEFGLQTLTLWSGAFMSDFEGRGRELPKHNGFMVEFAFLPGRPKVRVECPAPRTDENYEQVDAAIQAAFTAAFKAVTHEVEGTANTDPKVSTWANGFGIWHARVPANCISPLIAARRALRDELNSREAPREVRREIWLKPIRVPELDTPFTIVYREGPDGD